jgi:hypothetical protein
LVVRDLDQGLERGDGVKGGFGQFALEVPGQVADLQSLGPGQAQATLEGPYGDVSSDQ